MSTRPPLDPLGPWRRDLEKVVEAVRKSAVVARIEIPALTEAQRAAAHLAAQFEAIRVKVLEPVAKVAVSVAAAWEAAIPQNLRDVNDEEAFARAFEISADSGPCMIWAPRAAIVEQLTAGETFPDRGAVLVAHRNEILDDAAALLDDASVEVLDAQGEARRLAAGALGAARARHDEAAQALVAAGLGRVIHGALGYDQLGAAFKAMAARDVDEAVLRFVRFVHLELATANALINTSTGPEGFNRHGTLHGDPAFYGEAQLLAGVLLLSGWVRELSWWAERAGQVTGRRLAARRRARVRAAGEDPQACRRLRRCAAPRPARVEARVVQTSLGSKPGYGASGRPATVYERMFDSPTLESTRETAATLALIARRVLPWNRLAGAIEEEGSALRLLEQDELAKPGQLFKVEDDQISLDELENRVLAWEAEGMHLATVLDSAYPVNLRMVHDRPPALWYRGTLSDDDERSVAVVGTRSATPRGVEQAKAIAHALIEAGYVIVSGLASGIDTAAHTAALDADARTIAVIGTGLRESFPKENARLQERLGREAAVLSQFWPGQGARQWTFPQRNAVMSGFARATVVVEASGTSGARMQSRLAFEHGRPVFLLDSLLEHDWAHQHAGRPGTYVVHEGREIVEHLERLYAADELIAG